MTDCGSQGELGLETVCRPVPSESVPPAHHFKTETALSIREAMRPGDWAISIDFTDAYFHILVCQRDRKWLRFSWLGRVSQFRALPFGLSLAPLTFTRIARELALFAFPAMQFDTRATLGRSTYAWTGCSLPCLLSFLHPRSHQRGNWRRWAGR